jgi:hypothetical protein
MGEYHSLQVWAWAMPGEEYPSSGVSRATVGLPRGYRNGPLWP